MPGGIHPDIKQWLAWPAPNYIDPPTRPKFVLILSCIIGPISIALLVARLWIRICIQRNPGLDDWLMLASMVLVIALTVIFPLITEAYHFNSHVWNVEWKYFPLQRKYVMVIYVLFCLASGLIKMSVLLFYRRLSTRTVSPAFRWTLRITIASIGAYTLAFVFIPIFLCSPISAFWDQLNIDRVAKGYQYKCRNEGALVVANGVISTIQDFVAAFLPTLLCWKLQMPFSQKLALYAVFAVSYVTVVVGALRTHSCYRIFFKTYDVTWVASDTWLWTLLELHIGSMCANTPALKVFLTQILKTERVIAWKQSWYQSRSKLEHSNNAKESTVSSGSSTIIWGKHKSWKKHTRSDSGDLSELHDDISTDHHGGIIQMNAHFDPRCEQDKRTSKSLSSEYSKTLDRCSGQDSLDRDVEAGVFLSSPSDSGNDIRALPPLPISKYARWPHFNSLSTLSKPQKIHWDRRRHMYGSEEEKCASGSG